MRMNRFGGNIAYWGGKLLTDSLKDIKQSRNTSNYVERASDQIGYKLSQKSKMPRTTSYAKKRKRDRAMMPQSKRKSTKKRKRTYSASNISRFKKSRKPRTPTMSVKQQFDDHGTVSRDHVLWLGVHHHGTRTRLYDIASEAILRAVLAKGKVYPQTYDQSLNDHIDGTANLYVTYRTHNIDTGGLYDDTQTAITDINNYTFHEATALLSTNMQKMSVGESGGVSSGYYPISIRVGFSGGSYFSRIDNLDEAMLYINAFSTIKIQNLTQNGDGGNETDVVNTNPINGKRYDFKRPVASLRNELAATKYNAFEDHTTTAGIVALDALTLDDPLAHPPMAKNTFQSCAGVANVYLKSGQFKSDSRKVTIKMSVRNFISKISPRINDYWGVIGGLGTVSWYCFERTNKQNGSGDSVDEVKIGFNRELTMTGLCRVKPAKTMLRHYKATDLDAL
ncbi:hypothetical protein [Shewanella sp.]|uniref:hypothetical protein n=1 Tax=Shewanella sp. TaxID=50422 RepID=UPI004048D515